MFKEILIQSIIETIALLLKSIYDFYEFIFKDGSVGVGMSLVMVGFLTFFCNMMLSMLIFNFKYLFLLNVIFIPLNMFLFIFVGCVQKAVFEKVLRKGK